ncbi:MAG: beta-propeller fold lactonase family protein, partial [Actinomycetota bacterium]|nr:beta-propeller fold lactonase family protein [Actinomycetota bacterium]
STVPLPATANPGDILFNATGNNLIGIEVGTTDPSTFLIDSFVVGQDGRLTPAGGSPFAAEAAGPFGSEFSPTDPGHLYVSNAHGGAGNGSVSAFSVAEDGALGSIGSSPYADGQTAPCWVEISHDGRYLFAVNTGSTTISSYEIQADGSLVHLTDTAFASGLGIRPFDARLDVGGNNLYVVDAAIDAVSGFSVEGGSLTELGPSSARGVRIGREPSRLLPAIPLQKGWLQRATHPWREESRWPRAMTCSPRPIPSARWAPSWFIASDPRRTACLWRSRAKPSCWRPTTSQDPKRWRPRSSG